jgi:predicted secreted protein
MLRLFVVKVYFFVYGVTVFIVTPSTLRTNQHGGIFIVNTGKDRAKKIHFFVLK